MHRSVLCVFPVLLVTVAGAQTPTSPGGMVTLPQVADMVLDRSLEVKAAWKASEAAGHVVEQVDALKRGKVGLEGEYMHLNDIVAINSSFSLPFGITIKLPPVEVAPQDLIHLRLQAGYPLSTGGKIEAARLQAECGVEALKCVAEDAQDAAILQASETYLGCILAAEVVSVQEQALDVYGRHLAQAEKAFKAGVVARYDVIRAEAAVKEQERKVTEARNQRDLALAALRTALLIEDEAPLTVVGILLDVPEPLSLREAQAVAVGSSRILQALDNQNRMLAAAEEVEEADKRPKVTAIGQWEMVTDHMAQTDPEWAVGVKASLDLFDGGEIRAKMAEKRTEGEQNRLRRDHAAEQIRLAVQSAFLDMASARAALESGQKAEELATEALRLAQRRFEYGIGTSLEVLDANVALSAARLGQKAALHQYDRAWLRLHRYLGDISTVCRRRWH